MDRRTFVKAGCISSASLLIEGLDPMVRAETAQPPVPPIELHGLPDYKSSPLGLPGLFRGRVIEVRDPAAIVHNRVSQPAVCRLLDEALKELTGESSVRAAWAKWGGPGGGGGSGRGPA